MADDPVRARAPNVSDHGSVLLFYNGELVDEIDGAEMPPGPIEILLNPNWKDRVDSIQCYCWLVAVAVDGRNNVLWVQVPPHATARSIDRIRAHDSVVAGIQLAPAARSELLASNRARPSLPSFLQCLV